MIEIIVGVAMFTGVVLLLVAVILAAKWKLNVDVLGLLETGVLMDKASASLLPEVVSRSLQTLPDSGQMSPE